MPGRRKPTSKPKRKKAAAPPKREQIVPIMPPQPQPVSAPEEFDRTAYEIADRQRRLPAAIAAAQPGVMVPGSPSPPSTPQQPILSAGVTDPIGTPEGPLTLRALSAGNQGETVITPLGDSDQAGATPANTLAPLHQVVASTGGALENLGSVTSAGALKAEATVQAHAEATVLPGNWPAQRDRVLRRLDEILPLLEKILPVAAEVEAAYRERAGIGGNYPPEAVGPPLDVETVTTAIDAANVYRTELSSPQARIEVIRLCSRVLKITGKLIVAGLAALALGFVGTTGKHIADEVWPVLQPAVHDLVVQTESWLRTLGL